MIGIVDTNAGNLTSVRAALDRLGLDHVTLDAPRLEGVHTLLVPGQGRFGAVMETLDERHWREPLLAWHAANRPLVGICVGLQILFEGSDEDPGARGLGLLPGRAERLDFPKRPMVGWAPVESDDPALASGDAYFVNSFAVRDVGGRHRDDDVWRDVRERGPPGADGGGAVPPREERRLGAGRARAASGAMTPSLSCAARGS